MMIDERLWRGEEKGRSVSGLSQQSFAIQERAPGHVAYQTTRALHGRVE